MSLTGFKVLANDLSSIYDTTYKSVFTQNITTGYTCKQTNKDLGYIFTLYRSLSNTGLTGTIGQNSNLLYKESGSVTDIGTYFIKSGTIQVNITNPNFNDASTDSYTNTITGWSTNLGRGFSGCGNGTGFGYYGFSNPRFNEYGLYLNLSNSYILPTYLFMVADATLINNVYQSITLLPKTYTLTFSYVGRTTDYYGNINYYNYNGLSVSIGKYPGSTEILNGNAGGAIGISRYSTTFVVSNTNSGSYFLSFNFNSSSLNCTILISGVTIK